MNPPIYLTEDDLRKLRKLLREAKTGGGSDLESLEWLERELDRATVVEEDGLPPGVIAMNTRAEMVNLATNEAGTYALVFPDDADIDDDLVSVLAPLGMAMIGFRTGDEFEWPAPGGPIRFRVGRILARNLR